jgi:hypothetical protein
MMRLGSSLRKKILELLEATMSEPVSNWLRSKGLEPYAEVSPKYWMRGIDLIGWDGAERIVTVELKRSLTSGLIHQGYLCKGITEEAYVAVMSEPRSTGVERCKKLGVGILKVDGTIVIELLAPLIKGIKGCDWRVDNMIEIMRRSVPGGIGGLPCLKGKGPAQDVRRRIDEYRKDYPSAGWDELFKNVPNHYSSSKSMRAAQKVLSEKLERRPKI